MARLRPHRLLAAFMLLVTAVLLGGLPANSPGDAQAQEGAGIVVTAADDESAGLCPGITRCTLRAAIEYANADETEGQFTIRFAPEVFPPEAHVTITVTAPLPAITRADVTVDATGAGVVIDGSPIAEGADGLVLAGARGVVKGLTLGNFIGSCVVLEGEDALVGGDPAANDQLILGNCVTGIEVRAVRATIRGNRFGFELDGSEAPLATGVEVLASDATVGGEELALAKGNVFGHTLVAVRVAEIGSDPVSGVVIARNLFGREPAGTAVPIAIGVQLREPGNGTLVTRNAFANTTTAAIQVVADSIGNRFVNNTFNDLQSIAIDLGADGVRNENDSGDEDAGPNGLLNHPVFTRATQATLGGGTGCPGCTVELYRAEHTPPGTNDYGTAPLATALVTTDSIGRFSVSAPPVAPGQWITATVTDAEGNTSEFAESIHVGAGVIQCGNVQLRPGWNHVGFFGTDGVSLLDLFPGDAAGVVHAVYSLRDGESRQFDGWLRNGGPGQALAGLDPGEAYWIFADAPLTLPAGFSLTAPLNVELKAGWNEFVYFGASADVQDALKSLGERLLEVHRYVNTSAGEGFRTWGDAVTPAYARGFETIDACATYSVRVSEDVTLEPLDP